MSGDLVAAGQDPDPINPFQLLPSDLRGIEDAAEYAKERGDELKDLTNKVKDMGILSAFYDSKVPKKDKGLLTFSFQRSDPMAINAEIEKYLNFFVKVVDAVDKVDDQKKDYKEKENPYIIIIDLNKRITELFEIAQSGIQTTTSKAVSKLYRKFVARQSDLENKMKKMECVFLKQQLLAETERRNAYGSSVQRITDDGIAYKDQCLNYMTEEVERLKEQNREMAKLVQETSQKMQAMSKYFDAMKDRKEECTSDVFKSESNSEVESQSQLTAEESSQHSDLKEHDAPELETADLTNCQETYEFVVERDTVSLHDQPNSATVVDERRHQIRERLREVKDSGKNGDGENKKTKLFIKSVFFS